MSGFLRIDSPAGRPLEDILFERGVEFPCGGTELCGGCRIRVVAGEIPVTSEMEEALTLDAAYRGRNPAGTSVYLMLSDLSARGIECHRRYVT